MKAGFGKTDITPPAGVDLTGFIARENPSSSVLDPLHARALAVEVDGARLLLLGLDVIALAPDVRDMLRERLHRETGIAPERMMFMCSHSHSGPATTRYVALGRLDETYVFGRFADQILAASRSAFANLQPAQAWWGSQPAPEWNFYRRTDEPGKSDAALVDRNVYALWFGTAEKQTLGCFWSFTAHPTILCTKEISSEWVGLAARIVEETLGGVAVFGQGCAGDVSPIRGGDPYPRIRAMGEAIGEVLTDLHATARPIAIDSVAGAIKIIQLPLEPAPPRAWYAAYEAEQRALCDASPPGVGRRIAGAMADWAHYYANHDAPESLEAELQAVRLGPIVLVGLPFEPLSGVGHAIRARLGDKGLPLGYANACHAYLAPANQYPVGGYELEGSNRYYGLATRMTPECAGMVVDAARGMAAGLGHEAGA